MAKNRRLVNKKNTKITVGQELSRNENNTQLRREMALNGQDLTKTRGAKSYAEIAIQQGVYEDIGEFIKVFVESNPYFNQVELMQAVKENFPTVFKNYKSPYAGNFYKIIEKDPLWRESLQVSNVIIQRAVMRQLYKRASKGVERFKDSDGKYYEIGMKDKDAMDFVRLTMELEERAKAEIEKIEEKKLAENKDKDSTEKSITFGFFGKVGGTNGTKSE